MLEPLENQDDTKFGLDSELLNNLKRGTTLVEYRFVFVYFLLYIFTSYLHLLYMNECFNRHRLCLYVAALQILPKNSTLDTCGQQLLVSLFICL